MPELSNDDCESISVLCPWIPDLQRGKVGHPTAFAEPQRRKGHNRAHAEHRLCSQERDIPHCAQGSPSRNGESQETIKSVPRPDRQVEAAGCGPGEDAPRSVKARSNGTCRADESAIRARRTSFSLEGLRGAPATPRSVRGASRCIAWRFRTDGLPLGSGKFKAACQPDVPD